MKRIFAFVLSIIILLSSSISFAAPGDFIHTGLKKGYNMKNTDDRAALIRDLKNGDVDEKLFYREIEGGKYINIVEEEDKQEAELKNLLSAEGVDTSDPNAIEAFLKNPNNTEIVRDIGTALEKVTTNNSKSFDDIDDADKGYIEDYFKNIYAQRLLTPSNYSIPVPGSKDNATKIVNLTFPSGSGATRWMVKVGDNSFGPFEINKEITDGKSYNSGTDIEAEIDKYLLLAAVDANARIKAYASIKITNEMVRAPKVEAEKDTSITATLNKATNNSGTTTVSGLTGDWKLAVLDTMLDKVYETDKFNSVDYADGIELRVASDEELDNMSSDFKKYIIIYSEKDGKIEKYNIVEVTSDKVSNAFEAEKLTAGNHYSIPVKGSSAGTTKIEELSRLEDFGASKWMYKVGANLTAPLLDRVIKDSVDYGAGEDISIGIGQDLMILATDSNGQVKAYDIVKEITEDKIKNPLAEELKETTHYTKPVKGSTVGTTAFGFLKYSGISSWKYIVSNESISAPELGSSLETGTSINLVSDASDNIEVEKDEDKLKDDNGFRKYMMVYGLDGSGNVKVYKSFIMNDSNVKMPTANLLETPKNYSIPVKGNTPNTTRIATLNHTGLSSTGFRYKIIDESSMDIEFNQKIDNIRELRANVDITTTIGKNLLILAVDSSNRTKAYNIIKLDFDNVKAGNAPLLQPTTNYQGPVPGDVNNSTKFTFLNLPAGANKWVYKIGISSVGTLESGAVVGGDYEEYAPYEDITGVSSEQYLLLAAISSDNKVIAYREFRLNDNEVKGSTAPLLAEKAYLLMKGDNPSTTKLKLEPLGLENPLSIGWRYKLVDTKPTEDTKKPYLNQIVSDTTTYNVNYSTKIGPDIAVTKIGSSYGYILLLATDFAGRTKAYEYIEVTADNVKEHAPTLSGVNIVEGSTIDSAKVTGLATGKEYRYLISSTIPTTPASGDTLPSGVEKYIPDATEVKINIGKYLTIYEIDNDGKIIGYITFEIVSVKQGQADLSGDTLLEGNIKNGGSKVIVKLSNAATWADVVNNKSIRDKLFNGFKADKETSEWSKVVSAMVADGKGAINLSGDTVTILLPQTLNYDIKEEQKISLIIPAEAIEGAINPIAATGTITIKPTIGATISGDVVSSTVRQSDIKSGGKTIVVELADGIWNTDVSGIIDGFSGGTNWSKILNEVKTNGNIVRNSGTKVTITIPPVTDVDFGTTKEVISLTIPKSSNLIQGATEDVIASPNFTLYPDILQVAGKADDEKDKVTLMAPDYRIIDTKNDTWVIDVTVGTLKDNITNNDIIIAGLPKGLVATVSKVSTNAIEIKVSGTASTTLTSDTTIKVKIKGIAVTEPNSVDSDEIELKLIKGGSIIGELNNVGINVVDNKLTNTNENMQYSLDSTNGVNGTWYDASSGTETTVTSGFKAGKVYVRDKDNIKVFREVAALSHPKAPAGIDPYTLSVNYTTDKKEVELNGFEAGIFDFSLDGGSNWSKLDTPKIILTKDSDLRVRYSANENSLPSLATGKLNGLYLGNVTMNVGAGKIIGTTTTMEYSLNDEDTYTTAKANETPVSFVKDETVIIREKARPLNKYTVGIVDIVTSPTKESISFDILAGTITDTGKRGLQYRIGNDSWKDLSSTDPSTAVDFKQGKLEVRAKGDADKLPSEPVELAIIANPASAPELIADDFTKNISYWNGSSELLLEDASLTDVLEYNINGGPWKTNTTWTSDKVTDLIKNGNPKINVRHKAKADTLPSLTKTISFTGNLTFENVKLNVVEGKIEGTTTAMQYSIDSTDGLNGTWIDAKASTTTISFTQGMKVYIREKSKTLNWHELSSGIGVEAAITTGDIAYSIVEGSITNKSSSQILEYRIGTEPWKSIDRSKTVYGVEFKAGTLQIRAKGTESTLPSSVISVTIKAKASAPQLKYDDTKYTIEKIGSAEGVSYEYSINGGSWISGNTNTQFEGGNVVLVRLKATDELLPSLEQKITFTHNLDLGNVILNVGKSQLENTSTLMEYSIDSTNGEDGLWFQCTATTTKIDLKPEAIVYVREKAKPRNSLKLRKDMDPIKKKDFINGNVIVNSNLDYDLQKRTISINGVDAGNKEALQNIVNDLQYRIDNGNWINVDYVTLVNGETILAFNVNFVAGNLAFRLKGDENTLPSDSILKYTIKAPISAPNVSVGFDLAKYRNSINGTITNLEYSFGPNGPWIDGVHLDSEDLADNVYVRTKANKNTLPSLVKTLEFTPVLNLKTINLSTHVKPLELNGTTAQMEYRINGAEWKPCSEGNTQLKRMDGSDLNDLSVVNKIEIRDSKQHGNTIIVYP
ncbi:hypothetical protein NE686_12935 [Tissierella carlieri]|uniref:Uncharacterized protein n=1 Tax=Tissierella carlieri TaxID=689904 RepID=A0ABT1SC22_9FIRM|nr:hypothetical protein [Tissierella carlieri]